MKRHDEDIFESGNDSRLKLSNLTVTQRRADIPTEKPRKDFRPLRKSVKADESNSRNSTQPPASLTTTCTLVPSDAESIASKSGNDSRLELSNLTATRRKLDISKDKSRKDFRPPRKSIQTDESHSRASAPPPIPNSTLAANESAKSGNDSRQAKSVSLLDKFEKRMSLKSESGVSKTSLAFPIVEKR